MRFLIVFLALCVAHGAYGQGIFGGVGHLVDGIFGDNNPSPTDPCDRDVEPDYEKTMSDFHNKLYARIAARTDNHFVFSPSSMWLSLSALAEGADKSIQRDLFTSLNLPPERCLRRKFYDIALNAEEPERDVLLDGQRILLLDRSIKVNPSWSNLMKDTELLQVDYAPIKRNPKKTSEYISKLIGTRSKHFVKGNSVLLDALDYDGIWTTAFPEANIIRQPFYNDAGEQIGTIDMMHMRKKVRLAQAPFMDAKVLELPVGRNGQYTMLIVVGTGDNIIKNAINVFMSSIMEIFSLLQISLVPLDIAVPRFRLTSEFDARALFEDVDMRAFWRNPAATRYVSRPPAIPSGLIQRVSVKFNSKGVEPLPVEEDSNPISGLVNLAANTATGVATALGHDFIADRPFMFALFEKDTHTCLFAGAFSKPHSGY